MSAVETEITVVPRRAPTKMKWFDGKNVLEVAEWLVGHGTRSTVDYHPFGHNLKVNSYTKEVPKGQTGVWIDTAGHLYTVKVIEEEFEKVTTR